MFSVEKSGVLSFIAEDDADAEDIYDQLMLGLVYPDDLEDSNESVDESDQQFYELRTSTGKLLAD
jgi:hypothetical protein